jgi:hypothetical protein
MIAFQIKLSDSSGDGSAFEFNSLLAFCNTCIFQHERLTLHLRTLGLDLVTSTFYRYCSSAFGATVP